MLRPSGVHNLAYSFCAGALEETSGSCAEDVAGLVESSMARRDMGN